MMWTTPDFVNESQNIYNRDGDNPYAEQSKTSLLEEWSVF